MNGTTLAGALFGALVLLPLATAQTQTDRTTLLFPFVPGEPDHIQVDGELLGWLEGQDRILLVDAGIPGAPDAGLALDRVRLPDDLGGKLRVDGKVVGPISEFRSSDLTLWSGRVDGELGSDVFMIFSSAGTWGWVRFDDTRTVHLQCGPHPDFGWAQTQARWIEDAALRRPGFEKRFECHTAKPDQSAFSADEYRSQSEAPVGGSGGSHDVRGGNGATGGGGGGANAPATVLPAQWTEYIAEAVIETDYAFYQEFNNLTVATNYATGLIGANSARYEEQIGCLWDLASLSIYTSNGADPYSGTSPSSLLNEMKAAWDGGGGLHTLGDFGLILSGHGGGGVAYLNELCDNNWAVGSCCSINGNANFPVTGQSSLNWDFVVTTHEAGHIFNGLHTHDFCPPLDHCDSNCDGFTNCPVGTIMSYCHTCSFQGVQHITPYFHQTNATRMRNKVVAVNCLQIYVPPPTQPVINTITPSSVPALSPDAWPVVTLTGQNFSTVTGVSVDNVPLTGFPPQYVIVSDTQMTLQIAPVSKLGPVAIRLTNAGGFAVKLLTITPNPTTVLDMVPSEPSFWVQATGTSIYYAGPDTNWVYLVVAVSDLPTIIPGIVSLDIGNNLLSATLLGFFAVDPIKGWALFKSPLGYTHFVTGTRFHVQGVIYPFQAPTLPFQVTNKQSVTIVF